MSFRGSYLIVPGLYREDLTNPVKSIEDIQGADANVRILDLEDGVGPGKKELGRQTVVEALDSWIDSACTTIVRINGLDTTDCLKDLNALFDAQSPPDAIMLPEIRSGSEIRAIAQFLDSHGSKMGIVPLVERPEAVFNVYSIATSDPRIESLVFGDYDFRKYMGISTQNKHPETLVPRYLISMAASAAGVPAIDTVYLRRDDLAGVRSEAKRALSMGFDGKLATAPKQVDPINEIFRPTDAEIRTAKKIINTFEKAGDDSGLIILDEMIIDKPVVEEQRTLLTHAREMGVDVDSIN